MLLGPGPRDTGARPDAPLTSRRAGLSDCRSSRYQGLRCSSSLEILRGADQAITSAIDSHVQAGQRSDEDDDGQTGTLAPVC